MHFDTLTVKTIKTLTHEIEKVNKKCQNRFFLSLKLEKYLEKRHIEGEKLII